MQRKLLQKVLRKQFWFRSAVLLISLIGFVLYVVINCDWWLKIDDLVLGICGSAFVWSLVEIFDFFVKTYSRYCSERAEYLLNIQKVFDNIVDIIRNSTEDNNWEEVCDLAENLYRMSCKYPFKSEFFALSKEFFEVHSYLERLFWKMTATNYLSRLGKKEAYYKNIIINALVKVETETESDIENFAADNKELVETWKKIAEIPLNFKHYDIPSKAINYETKGNISYTFSFPGNIHTYKTFVPSMDFEKIHNKKINSVVSTVLKIIFRKLEDSIIEEA